MLKKFIYNLLAVAVGLWVVLAMLGGSWLLVSLDAFGGYNEAGVFLVFAIGTGVLIWLFGDLDES